MLERRHLARIILGLVVSLAFGAMVWPGHAWFAASAEPFVLGLPWPLVWNLIWLGVTFLALLTFHLVSGEGD